MSAADASSRTSDAGAPFVDERGAALLVVGVRGSALDHDERRMLASLQPGGVILLPRNVTDSAEGLAALTGEIRALVPRTLLYLDAEGGRVDRLRKVVGPAPAGADLAVRPSLAAQASGAWIGRAMAHFGFDVDLAPVVDLDFGRADNALDRRYLGPLPQQVTPRARAFLRGLHGAGIGGCLKHFPGLGAAEKDTHREGTTILRSRGELRLDLAPFRSLAAAAGAVMASHATYPELDPERRPATLSPPIATGLLRRELALDAVLLSDDLEMGALAPWGDLPTRTAACLAAGCDVLLLCHTLEAAAETAARLESPELAPRRRQAAARLAAYRAHLASLRALPLRRYGLATIRRRLAALAAP